MAPDSDEEFDADMEALKRAFVLVGASPSHAAAAAADVPSSSDSDVGENDDIELARDIEKRYALTDEIHVPLDTMPLRSIFPTAFEGLGLCDDDLEILRDIQRRYGSYNDDKTKEGFDKELHKPEQVGATNITSEEESCNNFLLERTNAGEGFPTCVDGDSSALQISEECSDGAAETVSPRSSGFPKSAHDFMVAIRKNRALQKLIEGKRIQMEARIEELKSLQVRVKALKDFQVSCRKRTGHALAQKKDARVQLISIPRKKGTAKPNEKKCKALYHSPPENSRVASYRDALVKFPVSVNRERWSNEERENLLKGVKQQFQEAMFQRSIDISDMHGSSGDATNINSNISSIKNLDITPGMMRSFLPKVNWDRLASMYIPRHSGAECQTRWLNWEDPLINQEPWSVMEDKNLLHIVEQNGLSNWIGIAISLGTNRTPFQCLARFQRSLNPKIIKREWTKEEDNKLRDAVEVHGESNWQVVAASLEGRTGTQCSNRWIKTLHPARQRVGKWTADEDKRLKVAVMLFGPKTWRKVAQYVPGRTHVQCRERWVNSIDPSLNLNKWTKEEDLKLKAAIEEHGYSWSKVAACVAPRTDSQCRRRWKVLYPHEVPLLQEARKIQKAAFISNFVDRESERPSLKPEDFVPVPLLLNASQSETSKKRKAPSSNASSEDPRITNGMEVENCRDDITSNKAKKSKRQRTSKTCTDPGNDPPYEDPGMISNGNEPLELLGVAMQNRRKLPPRKSRKSGPYEEVPEIYVSDETTPADGIIFKKSTSKTELDPGNGNVAKLHSSSIPNLTIRSSKRNTKSRKKCNDLSFNQGQSDVDGGEKNDGENASSHKGESALQECSGSNLDTTDPLAEEHYDSSLSFEESAQLEFGAELVEGSHNSSLSLSCLDRDVLETRNASCPRDVAYSNKMGKAEEDDSMTLAAFVQKQRNPSATVTASSCSGTQGHEIGDDMPIAHFFNKLKKSC